MQEEIERSEQAAKVEEQEQKHAAISRRKFLKLGGVAAVITTGAVVIEACSPQLIPNTGQNVPVAPPATREYNDVPEPSMMPPPDTLAFLTQDEAAVVDAIIARLIPGNAQNPGALEADVRNFIDKKLAFRNGFDEPTYQKGPFAKTYEGDQPPAEQPDVVWVKKSELERYGFQSKMNPQQIYRQGLAELQKYTNQKFGSNFEKLNSQQQDQVLKDMEDGKLSDFKDPPDKTLFGQLHDDTIDGFLSDPGYGGNKNMVGWLLVQYPGAQRAYTPTDMHDETSIRPPQDLAMLHNFHPGEMANPDVIVPPSGPSSVTPQP